MRQGVVELLRKRYLSRFCAIFIISRAITPKLSGGGNQKIGGAQQLMLRNIPMKFEDSRSRGC